MSLKLALLFIFLQLVLVAVRVSAYNATQCQSIGGNCVYDPDECGPCSAVNVIDTCVKSNQWALTFDDGPFPTWKQVLSILKDNNVRATFCVLGKNVDAHPAGAPTLSEIVADGHQIVSHTYSHTDLKTLSDSEIKAELTKAENTIRANGGADDTWIKVMRPPLGSYTDNQRKTILNSFGYQILMWNLDPNDWDDTVSTQTLIQNITSAAQTGKPRSRVQLGHADLQSSVDALAAQIAAIRANGYEFVTISECAGLVSPPVRSSSGVVRPSSSSTGAARRSSSSSGVVRPSSSSTAARRSSSSSGVVRPSSSSTGVARRSSSSTSSPVRPSSSSTGAVRPSSSSTSSPVRRSSSSTASPARVSSSSTASPARVSSSSTASPARASSSTASSPPQNCVSSTAFQCDGVTGYPNEQPIIPGCTKCCCNWGKTPVAGTCGCA